MFVIPIRVYYEDTDASGVVYHASYLRYFERARTEWLRALGFSQQSLAGTSAVAFTVSRLNIEYRRPARLDDALTVTSSLAELRRASLVFEQHLLRGDVELARAQVRAACVDAQSFRPRGLPATLYNELSSTCPPA